MEKAAKFPGLGLMMGKASIIRYMDHDTALSFVAVEWVEGGTLDQQRRRTQFTHQEVETVVHDALKALTHIHSHGGVQHRGSLAQKSGWLWWVPMVG